MSIPRIDQVDKQTIVNALSPGEIISGRTNAKFITLKKSATDKQQLKIQLCIGQLRNDCFDYFPQM